jgi:hypothetical protein
MGDQGDRLPPDNASAVRAQRLGDLMRQAGYFAAKQLTSDWTTYNRLLKRHREQPVRILEVGSYEGRPALFS